MRFPSFLTRLGGAAPLVIMLCALLAGCSGSASVSGTPTTKPPPTATPLKPTPPAGFSVFISPDGVYALAYPNRWSSAAEDGADGGLTVIHGVSFISSDKAGNLQVQPLNKSVAAGDYGVFVQSLAGSLGASSYTPGKADPIVTTSVTIGAHTWTELDGSMTLGSTTYTIKQFGTAHNGATVLVVAIAVNASFQQLYNDSFKPMLASITFFK